MKRILLLTLAVLIIIVVGFTVFGVIQAGFEEERLMDDLSRKARAVAESAEMSVMLVLTDNNNKMANFLIESFQKRERVQGCVIYDHTGKIVALTKRLQGWEEVSKNYIQKVLVGVQVDSRLEKFQDYTMYSYTIPIISEDQQVYGALEIVYDTAYVFNNLTTLWKRINLFSISLAVMTILILFLLQRQIFILPILKITDWFKKFQKGEIDDTLPIKNRDEFSSLISEVEQVALSLRVASKVVSDAAVKRVKLDEHWNEAKLKNLVQAKLGINSLFLVSNREPYMHTKDDNGIIKCIIPAGGVVTALDPVMRACGGTWIAHGAGEQDKQTVNSKNKLGVPPDNNQYILKRIWLSKQEEEGYYYGFSNEGLWPLCHMTHTRPAFKETDWGMYKKVNQKFADQVLDELPSKNAFVFIQDYHFTLLPKMIKDKRPDVTVAMFWHIPWPNPEVFAICPFYAEILEGILGCDMIGFHVQYHCNNFIDTCNRLTECRIDTEKFSVVKAGRESFIKAFPISVDTTGFGTYKREVQKKKAQALLDELKLNGQMIGLGVDRIDYTKGLVERVNAIDKFYEYYPKYKGKFTFIQIGAPSRTHIKSYHDFLSAVDEAIEKVNWRHGDEKWKPIIYLQKHFSHEEIIPYYLLSDLCIVSSLHDGMNLVAKEYLAVKRGEPGSLILSSFTGAARELSDALLINPYSTKEFADTIKKALEMPLEEKLKQMENLYQLVLENNVY